MILAGTWFVATSTTLTAVAVVAIGFLGFAIIPGMQARVMATAAEAPTLAMAVNASGYQVAAACAGLIGGLIADSTAGPRHIYSNWPTWEPEQQMPDSPSRHHETPASQPANTRTPITPSGSSLATRPNTCGDIHPSTRRTAIPNAQVQWDRTVSHAVRSQRAM